MEQIKDSSTPLNSPKPSWEGGQGRGESAGLGEGQHGREEENCFPCGPGKREGRKEPRESSWAQTPRLLLLFFFGFPVESWTARDASESKKQLHKVCVPSFGLL